MSGTNFGQAWICENTDALVAECLALILAGEVVS